MREWNRLWTDPIDPEAPEEYKACLRRAIMASINYVESRPDFKPRFKDRTEWIKKNLVPEDVRSKGKVMLIGPWETVFKPTDGATTRWFKAIHDASCNGNPDYGPSAVMMEKSIACGLYIMKFGWVKFNQFMATAKSDARSN